MEYNNQTINKKEINLNLIKQFPRNLLRERRIIPVKGVNGLVELLTDEYPPLPVIDDLATYSGYQLQVRILESGIINELVNEYLEGTIDSIEGTLNDLDSFQLEKYTDFNLNSQVENLEELAQEAPIIRLVNAIISNGLKKGASDIHIEPFEQNLRIRYRIDGILYENQAPPKSLLPAIITRIKIMANLNIAEHRLPQDGRIRIRVLGRELDIRVSIIPTLYGESAVLRILDRADVLLKLDNLGFDKSTLAQYLNLIKYPHGIILVTGPTGSGKTTTLYATLNYLNSTEKKIITIEDPVEYQLEGINQINVRPEIDFTFARGLRSILRQDPDIIMVGEIRDVETARIAIQAALTGHLVFATLHTNDAAGAVTRLLDMGVEDYLLASTLRGVLGQRLVRVLCPLCKTKYKPEIHDLNKISGIDPLRIDIYTASGCEKCNYLGFKGRTGIYELLTIDEELQSKIGRGIQIRDIKKFMEKKGVKKMMDDGREKIKDGITTIDEVIRVTRK